MTLEYDIERVNNFVVKKPRRGFEFKVERDVRVCNLLHDITPETCYDEKNNYLIQRDIEGRLPTDKEFEQIQEKIEERGVVPRGILKQDVIVDRNGKQWVVDVGDFEIMPETLPKFQKAKYLSCQIR